MIRFSDIHKKQCSGCKSRDFERIKKPVIFRLLGFGSSLKRYQCTKCFKIFYVLGKKTSESQVLSH